MLTRHPTRGRENRSRSVPRCPGERRLVDSVAGRRVRSLAGYRIGGGRTRDILVTPLLKAALAFRLGRGVQHLIVYVTARCPFRCRMCYVRGDPACPDLEAEELEPFIRAVGRVSMVDLGGGEPFLRDDLPRICALFPRAGAIGIPTSGWDPEAVVPKAREVLGAVGANRLYICVSIDGFQQTNDALRAAGSFDSALRTLRSLKAIPGLRVKVNTVLCRENLGELTDLMAFIRGEDPWFHSILLLRGDPRDPGCRLPALEEVEAVLPEVLGVQESYATAPGRLGRRIGRNYVRLLWDVSLKILRQRRQAVPCLAGRAHLVIWPNGDVAPCELLPPVGNIRTQSPEAILGGRPLAEAVQSIRSGACACTHNCNMVENILFNPRTYPALLGLGGPRRGGEAEQ